MKRENVDLLKKGDMLAFRPEKKDLVGKIIDFCSWGGGYCHVALVLDVNAGVVTIVESNSDHEPVGVRTRILSVREYPLVTIFRYNGIWNADVANTANSLVGSGYDLLAFPSTWFRSVVCRVFGWKQYRKSPTLIQDAKAFYCSELIAYAFQLVYGCHAVDGLHYTATTPNDLCSGGSVYKKLSVR